MLILTILSTWIDHLFCTFNHEHWLWDRTRLMSPLWRCQVSPNLIQPMEQRLSLEAAGKAFKENVCVRVWLCVCMCVRARVGLAGTRVWRAKALTFNPAPGACGFSQMPNGHMIEIWQRRWGWKVEASSSLPPCLLSYPSLLSNPTLYLQLAHSRGSYYTSKILRRSVSDSVVGVIRPAVVRVLFGVRCISDIWKCYCCTCRCSPSLGSQKTSNSSFSKQPAY